MSTIEHFLIEQGTTFSKQLSATGENGQAFDLTGAIVTASMKANYETRASFDFTVVIDDDPTSGLLTINMDASTTAQIPAGRYVYDVKLSSNGEVDRIVEGIITVSPEVTI